MGVVPASAFIPTDETEPGTRALSESEQHYRKQKNPRKRQRKTRTPSDDCLQRMGPQDDDSLSDDAMSSETQMSEGKAPSPHLLTASSSRDEMTPLTPTSIPEGVPSAVPPPPANTADDTSMDTSSDPPRNWADEVEAEHVIKPGEEEGDAPMVVSDTAATQ